MDLFCTKALATLTLASVIASGCGRVDKASNQKVYVRLTPSALKEIGSVPFDRDHRFHDRFTFGYIDSDDLDALKGIDGIVPLDWGLALGSFDPTTLKVIEQGPDEDWFSGYHNYEQLTTLLRTLAQNYPEIATLESAGRSVDGRELWYMRIAKKSPDSVEGKRPKFLYVANMHGDEVVGRELSLELIQYLVDNYQSSARVQTLIDNGDLFIMPSMNPDGFERGQRHNSRGSDLNRDFPDFSTDPRDTVDGREPETKAIMDLHQSHHFVLAGNFHGGEVCFNIPWDSVPNGNQSQRFGDDSLMLEAGREYTVANAPMYANHHGNFNHGLTYGYEWYQVNGGMQDWSIYYRGSTHATVELSAAKWPSASRLASFWQDNREGMIRYMEHALFGAHLLLKDSSGLVLGDDVQVTVKSGTRSVRYLGPYLHRPLASGQSRITIQAAGYASREITIGGRAFDGTFDPVILTPSDPALVATKAKDPSGELP